MAIVIIPPPTLAGGGDVTGGGDLNNANRVVIVAGTAEVGESDVSLASGIFSRAGTVGLSATGANVVTFSTNGSERGRWSSGGNYLIGTTTDDTVSKLQVAGNGLFIGPDGFNASNEVGKVSLGDLNGGIGRKYGIGLIGAVYKAGGGGTFGTDSLDAFTARESTGNMLIGGSTDGNYRLDVQSSGSTGTLRAYDQTAVTGSTLVLIKGGAGQSTNSILKVTSNANAALIEVQETKIGFFGATPVVQQPEGAGDAAAIITALKNLGLMAT